MDATHGALDGIRVLDVATILAAPLTAQILGDHGADVIKIEHPQRPDGLRGHGRAVDGHGLWWKELARNKRTLGLEQRSPAGGEEFLDLVRSADVVVENFRPGTLERWGLGPDELHRVHPGLVLLRVTGFGQDGPYADRPAFAMLVEAMSGFAHLTGEADGPPQLPAFGLADSIAAMAGASAVMRALYHRDARGGRGQVIDMSWLEPSVTAVAPVYSAADLVEDPQVTHRGMLVEVEGPDLGTLLQHNVLFRMSDTPGSIRSTGRAHGADTDEVLEELGYDRDRIVGLRGDGVIR